MAKQSHPLFTFEWTDLYTESHSQLVWTWLPQQELKNLLILFVKVLHADLGEYQLRFPQVTHLQDMDDVVMVTEDKTSCQEATDS